MVITILEIILVVVLACVTGLFFLGLSKKNNGKDPTALRPSPVATGY
jgi:flagellar basal body-associated protein FliL